MSSFSTTKMSSKGQVVIPEDIRTKLGLKSGARFMVVGDKDVVILKTISPPTMKEFDQIIQKTHKQAKEAGLTENDIQNAISKTRSKS
jgi:AbrB family looped-hinge helix DNA binding protein